VPNPRETKRLLAQFSAGLPPPPRHAADLLAGFDSLINEWRRDIETYVARGGSLLRIVVGPAGAGKTHLGQAVKTIAAQNGFLVSAIDAQSQVTAGDDLMLYRAFCAGLTIPSEYLDGEGEGGFLRVIEDVAERMTPRDALAALRAAPLPVPALRDALYQLVLQTRVTVVENGAPSLPEPWHRLAEVLAGARPLEARSIGAFRATWPGPFQHLRRLPQRRDARLWLESMLIALRQLGYPGTLAVLDEHDDGLERTLDGSLEQLRHQLDRLAEGHLPGVFVLQLVLEDFEARVRESHPALDQRITPILSTPLRSRLLAPIDDLRDVSGASFLEQVGERIHQLATGERPPPETSLKLQELARKHGKPLQGPATRAFVQSVAQMLQM
jgi:bacteriophage exclusion system BrxC/D-like protein